MSRTFKALEKAGRVVDASASLAEEEALGPEESGSDEKVLMYSGPTLTQVDEFLKLERRLKTAIPDKENRAILFTSASGREGTSTLIANLAVTMAKKVERRVLLVDANLRHPSLHNDFQGRRSPGLTDYLNEDVDLELIVNRTSVDGLDLIPAGSASDSVLHLLESPRLLKMISELASNYHYMLFDCAHATEHGDANVLGSLTDGVIMVVQSGFARKEVVNHAKEVLTRTGATILGVVLNRRKFFIPGAVYKRL